MKRAACASAIDERREYRSKSGCGVQNSMEACAVVSVETEIIFIDK